MSDFCRFCGAGIPPLIGEGQCEKCNPEGVKAHTEELSKICPICGGFTYKCKMYGHIKEMK